MVRWLGFALGVALSLGTVTGVMKTFIVPRRAWSPVPTFLGRNGYRLFHGIAVRLGSFDLADRLLGFLAPTVIIGILASFLASFVLAFALLLLPWADLTFGEALRESGSSVFTLGFVSTDAAIPTTLDILGGATGMIFVALTIGYLPTLYGEVTKREAQVKQLEGWTGVPSWGPGVLAGFSEVGAVHRLPTLFSSWDSWAAEVAHSHMKYPLLTHFRLPRSGNHWLVALLAVMDAAALDVVLRPSADHSAARLLLRQGTSCMQAVAYPMRRVEARDASSGLDHSAFRLGVNRAVSSGYPAETPITDAWEAFDSIRSGYAPLAYELAYWTMASPAPWSGARAGFPDLIARGEPPVVPQE